MYICGSIATLPLFEDVYAAVKQHPKEYPPEYVREAAIIAYNSKC
jgi:hypothetical protein